MTPVFLLLVTWLITNGGGSSYQVEFGSLPLCEAAQKALGTNAYEINQRVIRPAGGAYDVVIVSAVCVEQKK